jgi:hypothetical protein
MALKDLSSARMLSITGAWLDPKRDRPRLETMPRVAPLLPNIQQAHDGVRSTHRKDATLPDKLAEIQKKQVVTDKRHDRKVRGVHDALTGFADLADDPQEAQRYLSARNELHPKGIKFIVGSYADEAGEVELAQERLTADTKTVLKAAPAPGGNLMKHVQAWFAAGKELGDLEQEKAKVVAEMGEQQAGGAQGNQVRARNYWIKVVRALLQNVELEEIDAETRRHILAPLELALTKAERRAAQGEQEEEEEGQEDELPTPANPEKKPGPR